jgi:hypothetical protein
MTMGGLSILEDGKDADLTAAVANPRLTSPSADNIPRGDSRADIPTPSNIRTSDGSPTGDSPSTPHATDGVGASPII